MAEPQNYSKIFPAQAYRQVNDDCPQAWPLASLTCPQMGGDYRQRFHPHSDRDTTCHWAHLLRAQACQVGVLHGHTGRVGTAWQAAGRHPNPLRGDAARSLILREFLTSGHVSP